LIDVYQRLFSTTFRGSRPLHGLGEYFSDTFESGQFADFPSRLGSTCLGLSGLDFLAAIEPSLTAQQTDFTGGGSVFFLLIFF
jgi:hypothetical protein